MFTISRKMTATSNDEQTEGKGAAMKKVPRRGLLRHRRLLLAAVALLILSASLMPAGRAAHAMNPEQYTTSDVVETLMYSINSYWDQQVTSWGYTYSAPAYIQYYDTPDSPGAINTSCGVMAVDNSFYCPADTEIYLDYSFLQNKINDYHYADGDYGDGAAGFILAHEWGHHIQNLLGWIEYYNAAGEGAQLELHADCLAGTYFHYAVDQGVFNSTDVTEAQQLAYDIGDSDGTSPSHGTPQQRYDWFTYGYDTGDPYSCDSVFS